MPARFNPPPNWPPPPPGWTPPPGWRPDPRWGPAPPGWQLWVDEAEPEPTDGFESAPPPTSASPDGTDATAAAEPAAGLLSMFNGESAEPAGNGARHRAALEEEEPIPFIGARSKAKQLAREVTSLRAEVARLRAELDRREHG